MNRYRWGWWGNTVFLATAIVLTLALGSGLASADKAPAPALVFPRLDIQILPEYDTDYPQALVIVQGSLKNAGSEPFQGEVVFRAPKNAQFNSACELSGDPFTTANPVHTNQLALGKAKVYTKDDHQEVGWTPSRVIKPGETFPLHMEFYYPAVTGGPDKQVSFTYSPTYGADKVTLAVVQPARSSGYSARLTEIGGGSTEEGTYVHQYDLGPARADQNISFQFSYKKDDNSKSIGGSGAAPKPASSGLAVRGNQVILLVALAMVLGLAFVLFYGGPSTRNARTAAARSGKSSRAAGARGRPAEVEEERRKARRLLLDGKISEETYREIIRDLEGKGR
ncbi:MAG: hypothetical protein M1602_05460 [Firmicutes bacterium]|nr:hypothetical protein [Bacillota bacterium]